MKLVAIGLMLLVLTAGMASAATACGNATPTQDERIQVQSQGNLPVVPYVNIYADGPSTAKTGETVRIDVAGELGNWITYYFQKFYIVNTATGSTSEVEYLSTPQDFSLNMRTWTKGGVLVGHDNFYSHWEVKFTKPGKYQVVAGAVGLMTIPSGQTSFFIEVT